MTDPADAPPYSGHVEPGGPPARRKVAVPGGMIEIRKLSVGDLDNNVYVLRTDDPADSGADTVLIDAADQADRILDLVADCRVGAIVTTHRHRDHWGALAEVAQATRAATYAGAQDAEAIGARIDHLLSGGDRVEVGGIRLEVLATPGHTPGSICLLLRGDAGSGHHLFTGDTLFPGGPGRTNDAEAFDRIMQSLRQRLFPLPDSTWVYPGHGDDTTLGAERPHLDEWQARGW